MGLYDREYYQDRPEGIVIPPVQQTAVGSIILINAFVFILGWLLGPEWLLDRLALGADLFQSWHLWELLTAAFAHAGVWHILLNMLVLWFFGTDVERLYGRKRFWQFYLSASVLASLGWVLSENLLLGVRSPHVQMVGASGAVAAVVMVFVCHWPRRVVLVWGILPMPVWLLALLWFGMDLVNFGNELVGAGGANVAYAAHLSGAFAGWVFYRWHWTVLDLVPWGYLTSRASRLRRSGPRLRAYRPEEDDVDSLDEQAMEAEVNRLLDKINEHGTDSLTPEERRFLERAARKVRQKLQS